jgi:hypothetical protein
VRKVFTDPWQKVLVQRRGSGTLVSGPGGALNSPVALTSFTQDMQLRGLKTDAIGLTLDRPANAGGGYRCRFHRVNMSTFSPPALCRWRSHGIELAVIPQHFLA